jgi:hypothetical protein
MAQIPQAPISISEIVRMGMGYSVKKTTLIRAVMVMMKMIS